MLVLLHRKIQLCNLMLNGRMNKGNMPKISLTLCTAATAISTSVSFVNQPTSITGGSAIPFDRIETDPRDNGVMSAVSTNAMLLVRSEGLRELLRPIGG